MSFKNVWDIPSHYIWDSWDGADGSYWVIRDILPEEEAEAVNLLQDHWCTDETLCKYHVFANDALAMERMKNYWQKLLGKRMSIGCYVDKCGSSKLVALSVFSVICLNNKEEENKCEHDETMVFQREWDEHCPRVWDSWDGVDGVKWVIRDLRPEDDEEAIKILVENFVPDETFCRITDLTNDSVSVENAKAAWRKYISQRMSLGCYEEKANTRKLVALNVCAVYCQGHNPAIKPEGVARMKAMNAFKFLEKKVDAYRVLGVDTHLHSDCLVVHQNYRGARLGSRILAAGDILSLHHHIKGITGEFTSTTSQKIAESVGFTTAATITFKELVEAGMDFPNDETKSIMYMVKKLQANNE